MLAPYRDFIQFAGRQLLLAGPVLCLMSIAQLLQHAQFSIGLDQRLAAPFDFDRDLLGAISRLAHDRSWQLCELREANFSLEDTFIALTKKSGPAKREVV